MGPDSLVRKRPDSQILDEQRADRDGADGRAWGLAGLWKTWTDKASGEIVESYTMLTMKADEHPIMRRMHKPDPKLAPQEQDKRSVIAIEPMDWDTWLQSPREGAQALIRLSLPEVFDAGPEAP